MHPLLTLQEHWRHYIINDFQAILYLQNYLKPSKHEINNSILNLISDFGQLSDQFKLKIAFTHWRQYVIATENKCKDMG